MCGYIETFSIPKEERLLISSYLDECHKKGQSRSKVIVNAIEKQILVEDRQQEPTVVTGV
jgi:hypothetical protein